MAGRPSPAEAGAGGRWAGTARMPASPGKTGARDRSGRGLDCFTALAPLRLPPGPSAQDGGEGGIRTLDTREGITVFETARFSRSRTSPPPIVQQVAGFVQVADMGYCCKPRAGSGHAICHGPSGIGWA